MSIGPLGPQERTTIRKNTGVDIGARRRVNLIEGANITLTIADDGPDDEIDVTIASTAGGGSPLTTKGDLFGFGTADERIPVGANGQFLKADSADAQGVVWASLSHDTDLTGVSADDHHPKLHQADHQAGGADALAGLLDATARVSVSKNSAADVGARRTLNFIEGANVTLTIADDAAGEEVDITIASSGAGSPLTTKGDLFAHDGTNDIRLPAGVDGQHLVSRSGDPNGVAWETPSAGGGFGGDYGVRFVREDGSDATGDGLSPATAFRTVSKAAGDLPTHADGYFIGTIDVGPGLFTESNAANLPILIGSHSQIIGFGTTQGDSVNQRKGTTVIDLAADDDLFAPPAAVVTNQRYMHHFVMEDVVLRVASGTTLTAQRHLLKTQRGGFGFSMRRVIFDGQGITNSAGWRHRGNAVNLYAFQLEGRDLTDFFLQWDVDWTAGLSIFEWVGAQIDDCGTVPIIINNEGSSNAKDDNFFLLRDAEFENEVSGRHNHIVEYRPRAASNMKIDIVNLVAWSKGTLPAREAVVFETNVASAVRGQFTLRNVMGSVNYTNVFKSALTGNTVVGDSDTYINELSSLPAVLMDGISAPTAISGAALLYVDSADGDLKVRFGDGVTKTLATDV